MTLNEQIEALCQATISNRVFPGCTVGYVANGRTGVIGFGRQTYGADDVSVTPDTIYDVASITKSIPTSALLMGLVESGQVGLDDQVIRWIPELENEYRGEILVRHLLTYTVVFDFPKGISEAALHNPAGLMKRIFSAKVPDVPGTRYLYTNVPAILMGLVIERVLGRPLDVLARQKLFAPLAMQHSTFDTRQLNLERVAPTEITNQGEIRGRVHDESAWAMAQGGQICGAAGLFSTVTDLLRFCQMLLAGGTLDGAKVFEPETVASMYVNQLGGIDAQAGLGWELLRPELRGTHASVKTFGKTGFTGCIVMIDPEKEAALVHLSNRTYPKRPESRDAINAFRRDLADLVFAAA